MTIAGLKLYTRFPHYLENFENLEFCNLLFHAWKMPGIGSKCGENLEFLLKTWKKKLIFKNKMVFRD